MTTSPFPAQTSGAAYTQTATYEHGVNRMRLSPFSGRKTTLRWVGDFLAEGRLS